MGREARCMGEFDGWLGEGKLLLETDDLLFRGASRLKVPLATIRGAEAVEGWLEITHAGGRARFDLGDAAAKWARSIRNPRTRADKLDVRSDANIGIVDIEDAEFLEELRARTSGIGDASKGAGLDLIFYRIDEPGGLERLGELRKRIVDNGAVWVITPKGRPELGHDPIVNAAKAAGLIDTKTARFSDTHTALKLVIPRARRGPVQTPKARGASHGRKRTSRQNRDG
jgi:hypothetical protein